MLKLLIIGAHPDDCEFHAGGLATIYRSLGHAVRMVSVTNGESGHHQSWGPELTKRRRLEAAAAAAVIGAESEVWDFRDGRLEPTLEARWKVVRLLREYQPDVVLCHRDNDYHPDHRAVGHLVRDAAYLITVPSIEPNTPILAAPPVFGYLPDRFSKPTPLAADVIVDVREQLSTIVRMLACHKSQFFEWLPFNQGKGDEVPADVEGQLAWLQEWYVAQMRPMARRYRADIVRCHGHERGDAIDLVEVYEISEYGAPLDEAARARLFPWLPAPDAMGF